MWGLLQQQRQLLSQAAAAHEFFHAVPSSPSPAAAGGGGTGTLRCVAVDSEPKVVASAAEQLQLAPHQRHVLAQSGCGNNW